MSIILGINAFHAGDGVKEDILFNTIALNH